MTRLTICSLCILTICDISYFPFWFWGLIWVLTASVPGLCILLTFKMTNIQTVGPRIIIVIKIFKVTMKR